MPKVVRIMARQRDTDSNAAAAAAAANDRGNHRLRGQIAADDHELQTESSIRLLEFSQSRNFLISWETRRERVGCVQQEEELRPLRAPSECCPLRTTTTGRSCVTCTSGQKKKVIFFLCQLHYSSVTHGFSVYEMIAFAPHVCTTKHISLSAL
jgi:hypothetical protein